MAADLGFEPRQTAPEAGVLPLHQSAIYHAPIERCSSYQELMKGARGFCYTIKSKYGSA